jgi:hypothetical protein
MTGPREPSPWEASRRAAGDVALPASLVLLAALALVIAYYHLPAVGLALDRLGAISRSGGLAFAAGLTALTAGLIPWLLRMAMPSLRPAHPWKDLLHSLVWWALMGIVVSSFYRLLTAAFGDQPSLGVVAVKVLIDSTLFTMLVGSPGNALSHLWKDLGWDLAELRRHLRPGWYRRIVVPNLLPNWVVWIPGAAIFYSLPLDLQLPVANGIGCCWALLCVRIAAHSSGADPVSGSSHPSA